MAGIGSDNVRKIPSTFCNFGEISGCYFSLLAYHLFLFPHVLIVSAHPNAQMDVTKLREFIERDLAEGKKPFYVCATAGGTVFGAFDNFLEISEISKEFGVCLLRSHFIFAVLLANAISCGCT